MLKLVFYENAVSPLLSASLREGKIETITSIPLKDY